MNFCIGSKLINNQSPTYFIAEIGSNFDGDLNRAIKLIKLAKDAGADAAKFQHYTAKSLVSDVGFSNLNLDSHQKDWDGSVYETYAKASLNVDWTLRLYEECKKQNIDFMTSPYSMELLEKTINYIPAIKIGSGDITYHQIIKQMASKRKPLLIATGATELSEVKMAYECVKGFAAINSHQCVFQLT